MRFFVASGVSSLSSGARTACRAFGILFILVGVGCLVGGFVTFLRGFGSFGQTGPPIVGFVLFLVGMVSLGIGSFLAKIGFMGLAAGIVATETSPAVEHAAGAYGRGLGGGLIESGIVAKAPTAAPAVVVKVKCRSCGYLESEDAKFCSSCAEPFEAPARKAAKPRAKKA